MAEADASARETLLMRGVLDMCVLALLDVEPLHASGVVRKLQEHGLDNVSSGSIYPLVTRLRRQGLVDEQLLPSPSGPSRNVLRTNAAGRAALKTWIEQWRTTTDKVSAILSARSEGVDGGRRRA